MKLEIKRLRFNNQYYWNLNGDDCKLFINGTTFTPRSKQLGLNLDEAVKEAERLNKEFDRFKQGLVPATEYTFKWFIQEFKAAKKWREFKDQTKKDYNDTFTWLAKIKKNNLIFFISIKYYPQKNFLKSFQLSTFFLIMNS